MKKLYTFTLFLFTSLFSFAQQPLVQNFSEVNAHDLATLIMGEQATISNAEIQGAGESGGLFMGASDLGFANGVILTSGGADLVFGPNDNGSIGRSNEEPGDSDLEIFPWGSSGSYDACILEFDFVPTGDQISLNYIFGSEEYPEWIGTQFNDAFGIFIEGGSEYPADMSLIDRNLAKIPDTDIDVAINFLNSFEYSQYYIDNTDGQYIQYDAFTTPLPATANVTPGVTYHLKFVISDVGDYIYDSGIFIALNGEDILAYKTLNLVSFWDENGNNLKDDGEIPLLNQVFLVEPSNKILITNSEGEANLFLLEGMHQVSYQANTLWEMNPPTTYDITVDEEVELPTYYFGLQPSRILTRVEPHLNSNPTRCNTEVSYYLDYSNTGTTVADGRVVLEFDDLMNFVEASPQPDVIEDGKLTWNFADLQPTHQNQIQLRFGIPDENFIGEMLETQALVELFNDNQEVVYSKSSSYDSEVRCSYDPNDKLVQSNLLEQSEFAYIDDEIFYTIRFQNTGNDVAFNVRVEDELDKKLDWTTFRSITASHDFYTEFNRSTGKVTFYFDDIMLPDHMSNEPESHGFVMFGIASLSELEDKTTLENTASIFFDENPPIVTNTAVNTLVAEVETDIEDSILDVGYSILIHPNPFSDYTMIEVGGLSPQGNYQLQVTDILGRQLRELTLANGKANLQRGDLESGMYLIQILEKESGELLGSGKVLVE